MALPTPELSRRQPLAGLWLAGILALCLALVPKTTLLGETISALGQAGLTLSWVAIVTLTSPLAPSFRIFLWLLVAAMIAFQGSAVYFHWQADQLRLPAS
ncbi:hypothetical protein [Deinococcus sp. Leaf326]|uniref:hypothetical protein n=1 Tax=Deinococcus sp. Leaf326 TaxID=1736338 RepID=UPI0006F24594|nr:hypothetical protein [Deinococcus sp. Leaf326]KQR00074.1 hypothetical protein ASF71_21805 [Deinococcus sp. Leaf326]